MAASRPDPRLVLHRGERQSSIDDQVAACRRFVDDCLPKGIKPKHVVIDVIKEPEVSGEITDRVGINQVENGIEAKRWDLIFAEESSRFYRHHTRPGELFETAAEVAEWLDSITFAKAKEARQAK